MKGQFHYFLVLIIWLVSCQYEGNNIKSLPDSDWEFKAVGDTNWLPVTVPGYVHIDLLNNNQLRVTIVSDKLKNIEAKLKLLITDFEGNILWTWDKQVQRESSNTLTCG